MDTNAEKLTIQSNMKQSLGKGKPAGPITLRISNNVLKLLKNEKNFCVIY